MFLPSSLFPPESICTHKFSIYNENSRIQKFRKLKTAFPVCVVCFYRPSFRVVFVSLISFFLKCSFSTLPHLDSSFSPLFFSYFKDSLICLCNSESVIWKDRKWISVLIDFCLNIAAEAQLDDVYDKCLQDYKITNFNDLELFFQSGNKMEWFYFWMIWFLVQVSIETQFLTYTIKVALVLFCLYVQKKKHKKRFIFCLALHSQRFSCSSSVI